MRLFIFTALIIFYQSVVLACNFQISNFGDAKSKLSFDNFSIEPMIMPDRFEGENLIIPLEEICKNDKKIWGTKLIHLYVEDKLVRIQLYRPVMNDRNLMDFAMQKYGKFNLPSGISKNAWRGSHRWEKGNQLIEYIVTNIHDGHVEIIEVSNRLYLKQIEEYNEKVGEWLDTRE